MPTTIEEYNWIAPTTTTTYVQTIYVSSIKMDVVLLLTSL